MLITNALKAAVSSNLVRGMINNLNPITTNDIIPPKYRYDKSGHLISRYNNKSSSKPNKLTPRGEVNAAALSEKLNLDRAHTTDTNLSNKLDSLINVTTKGFESLDNKLGTLIQAVKPAKADNDTRPPSLEQMDVYHAVMGHTDRNGVANLNSTLINKPSNMPTDSSSTSLLGVIAKFGAEALHITAAIKSLINIFSKLPGFAPRITPKENLSGPPPEEPTPPAENPLPGPPPEEPVPPTTPINAAAAGEGSAVSEGVSVGLGEAETAVGEGALLEGGELAGSLLLAPEVAPLAIGATAIYAMRHAVPTTPEQRRYSAIDRQLKHLEIEKKNIQESIGYLVHSGGNKQEIFKDEQLYADIVKHIKELEFQRKILKPTVDDQTKDQRATPYNKGRFGFEPAEHPNQSLEGMPPSVVLNAHQAQDKLEAAAGVPKNELPFKLKDSDANNVKEIHHHTSPVYNNTTVNNYNGGAAGVNQPTTYRTPADKSFSR